MSDGPKERKLGRNQGCRLWEDQETWLDEMKQQRSAAPHALIRAAVDHYRPVYEALSQGVDPELMAVALEAARVHGVDRAKAALVALNEEAVAAAALPTGTDGGVR